MFLEMRLVVNKEIATHLQVSKEQKQGYEEI